MDMGFFDKVKTFVGDHGCKVELLDLERQPVNEVRFPVGDSVFKGRFRVTASKPCTVLAHKVEVVLQKKHADGREEQVILGSDVHDAKNQVIGLSYQWPYEMAPGQSNDDGFVAVNIDIPGALQKLGYADAAGAASAPELAFFVRVTADVKGTPMDAEAKAPFAVVA
jgi:hypothetical protein